MADTTKSLVLENYFPTNPNVSTACVDNSNNLEKALKVCYTAAGKRWSNFVAVDMYEVCCLAPGVIACQVLLSRFVCWIHYICCGQKLVSWVSEIEWSYFTEKYGWRSFQGC